MAGPLGPTPRIEAEAQQLFWELVDQPMTVTEIMAKFGWNHATAKNRLEVARQHICPLLTAAIPRAIAADGYSYRVIDADNPSGTKFQASITTALGDSETRLKTIHRVARVGMDVLDGRTRHGKAAKIIEFRVRQAIEELALLDGR